MIRRIISICLAAAVLTYGGIRLWQNRHIFKRNHVKYLINQQLWEQAALEARKLSAVAPTPENKELLARTLLNVEHYQEARSILNTIPARPTTRLLDHVAAFESGETTIPLGRHLWSAVLPMSQERTKGNRASIGSDKQATTLLPENIDPVVARAYLGQEGLHAFASGAYDDAATVLAEAWRRGEENDSVVEAACAAHAIVMNFHKARMIADKSAMPSRIYMQTIHRLRAVQHDETRAIDIGAAQVDAEIGARVTTAILWCRLMLCHEQKNPTCWSEFISEATTRLNDHQDSCVMKFLLAEATEHSGDYHAAYELYQLVNQTCPSFSTTLRLQSLVPATTGSAELGTAVAGGQLVARIPAQEFDAPDAQKRHDGGIAFYRNGKATISFHVPDAGLYQIIVVAAGDRAFGLFPVLRIRVNDTVAGELYIAYPSWDAFSTIVELQKGKQNLAVEYVNNSERLVSNEEDRNVYLKEVMIASTTGARD